MMRKSKLASSCLYISLGTILLNIIALVFFVVSTQLETISLLYKAIILLSVATFIGSIVAIVRIAASKKQLKGMVKSITSITLSILMFGAGIVQLVLTEAAISVNDVVQNVLTVDMDSDNADSGENSTETDVTKGSNVPRYVKKDFDAVAIADYYGELDKVGYIDKEGDFVIEPKFDDAKDFYEGLAPVKVGRKWGYIDKTGEFVIEPQFDNADIFSSGVAAVQVDGKWGFIDKTGEFTIPPSLDTPRRFTDGLVWFKSEENGKYGFMDTTGKVVISPEYFISYGYFSEGYVYAAKDKDDFFASGGILDKEGNFISLPAQTVSFTGTFSEGLMPYSKKGDELMGFIDFIGNYVIEPQFFSCSYFSEGLASVAFHGGGSGYIDRDGNIIIKSDFSYTRPFSDGLALVNVDVLSGNSCGYIDKTGAFVIEPQFTYANNFSEGLALVTIEGQGEGFIDKTGQFVIGPVYYANFGRFHKIDGVFDPKTAEYEELEIK